MRRILWLRLYRPLVALLGSRAPRLIGLSKSGAISPRVIHPMILEKTMWTKPEFTEMRFGFEVTMYIANR